MELNPDPRGSVWLFGRSAAKKPNRLTWAARELLEREVDRTDTDVAKPIEAVELDGGSEELPCRS